MKVERFIVEYANYVKRRDGKNELMNNGIKKEIMRRCDDAVKFRERGYITVDEAIRMIAGEQGEDMSRFWE